MADAEPHTFDAFLSYASVDRRRVTRIQRFLERALRSVGDKTASVYMDETDIRGGRLTDELRGALMQSKALIVCCSAAAKQSTWVAAEVSTFTSAAPDRPVVPLLLDGTPGTAFPPGLPADLRFHDLRVDTWLGVLRPAARDELLRVTALLSGAELRKLINWDRRRVVTRGAVALAASVPVAGTGWWLFEQAMRVWPADVSARVAYTWATGDIDNGRRLNDLLSRGARLTLRAAIRPGAIPARWPKRTPGVLAMPDLVLTGDEGSKSMTESLTVDDASYVSTRAFASLSGRLGRLDRRSAWEDATFEAMVQVMDPEASRDASLQPSDRVSREWLQQSFDTLYGVQPGARAAWNDEDYAVTPLPIRATLQVLVNNAEVWSAEGMAARVWEHDEDVRGLCVVYFPARTR